jgi:hypothetical protein
MRKPALAAILAISTFGSSARAGEIPKELPGVWQLTGYTLQVVGEQQATEPFGPGAKGSLVLTLNGRWIIVVSGANRKPATNNDERAALLGTLIAYTGKYTVDGDRVTTDVDTSWNEIYTGKLQKQTRFFKVDGDKLTIHTGEIESAVRPGQRIVATLTWQREK